MKRAIVKRFIVVLIVGDGNKQYCHQYVILSSGKVIASWKI